MTNDEALNVGGRVIELLRENERLRAERDALTDTLHRHGFRRCDVPACACGQFHHRFGLPERMQEIKDALAAAGHEVSNKNGNLPLGALWALVAERSALRAERDALLASAPRWIPCSERMPDAGSTVMVYLAEPAFPGAMRVVFDCWDEQYESPVSFSTVSVPVGLGWDSGIEYEAVTHWMPLPAAPEEAK